MKLIYSLVLLCFIFPCSVFADDSPALDASFFKPARYIMSPRDVLNSLQGDITGWPKAGYWFPDKQQIDVFEAEIRKAISENDSGLREFDEYTVQYVGLTKQGTKLILANAFCFAPAHVDLDKQVFFVSGGGNCYFGALFEPVSAQLIGLSVNQGY